MSDHFNVLLDTVRKIHDLVELLAEEKIAQRDAKQRATLRKIVGASTTKQKSIFLMDGMHSQKEIHIETSVHRGDLSTMLGRMQEAKLLVGDTKKPQLAISIPKDFLTAMDKRTEERAFDVLVEIRNWIRAAAHGPVKNLLQAALPDPKSRAAYQMLDGTMSMEQVRIACKMSPNGLLVLANRCAAMGLMEVNTEKKRVRLFDLADFGLIGPSEAPKGAENGER